MNNKSIFETKEQYLAFRAAFAAAQNDERSKPHFTEESRTLGYGSNKRIIAARIKHSGWLQSEHFIILNAIRGKPLDRGFTGITSKNKLMSHQDDPMYSFNGTIKYLKRMQERAKLLQSPEQITISAFEYREFARLPASELADVIEQLRSEKMKKIEQEFEPLLGLFAGTLTIEQFASLNLGE